MAGKASKKDPLLPIGEITRRSGIAASALRYYESLGLISSSRQGTSRRFFPRSTLRRVAFIIFAQKIGYSLEEIGQQLARLPTGKLPTNKDWQALSRGWKQQVAQRIGELQRLDMDLDHCIGCGCLSLQRCKLANPNDAAGASGTGPRLWLTDQRPEQG
ncbi:redox-sensitive transcriptional activator SoxR [Pseudomonas sp. FIP_A4]|uniref:redox-sensitive transcriptional activator SoxR n=1 Tax=Pseudomonas sp. FIP_A4 TaxID=3070684 RepID=UPI00051DD5F3|nr:transcriptional regulator [Stutzerimonas degradans]MDT3709731.1 redox-sensitive transcriptional activator SoxR [Pseudomonadaceae bacterium]QGW22923.1 redox-sensitive transcriptional activator SoxR [Stutzerimonas degradans]